MSKRYDEAMELYQDGIKGILNNELQKAIIQFQKAQREFEAMSDHAMYCKSVNTMGVAYAGLGNDLMAVDCYLNGLNHAKTYGVVGLMSVFYNNIGTRYLELGEYKSAIKYCLMAEYDMIATGPDNKDNASWYILTYLNLAEGYYELEDYINSQIYIHKAKEISGRYDYHDADFSRGVLEARIEHALGRNEIVKELLPILIKQSERATINISDYCADVTNLLKLLGECNRIDDMLIVIKNLEDVANKSYSPIMELKISEFYMDYYRLIEDVDRYREACVRYTESFALVKEKSDVEYVQALNVKIALQEAEEDILEAQKLSEIDTLTNLSNRYALNKEGKELLDKCEKDKLAFAVGIMDIDCFKQYNDNYGHLNGDEILKRVAAVLTEATEHSGKAYRYGGDEFIIIFAHAKEDTVKEVADRITYLLEKRNIEHKASNVLNRLTLSQGYYITKDFNRDSMSELIEKADKVLYKSKNNGKNQYNIESSLD